MNRTSKILNFGENIPVQMRLEITIPQVSHWHNYVELYYVLEGVMTLSVIDQEYTLEQDQLIVVNPFELHACLDSDARIAIFTINLALFDHHVLHPQARFNCNSLTNSNEEALFYLKGVLAKFVKNNAGGYEGKELINKSLSYELLHILMSDFSAESSLALRTYGAQMARMENILQYTNEHYAEHLSLSELANRYFLTVPYMSKFFKTMMGTTFTDYMNDIRLSHVLNDLISQEVSTETLAQRHGFANTRSLVTAFRNKHHMTPAQYKRQLLTRGGGRSNSQTSDPMDMIHTNHLGILSQYLTGNTVLDTNTTIHRRVAELPPLDLTHTSSNFVHSYQKTAAIGKAKEILFSENQKILAQIQTQIGFEFLCFHGLLDDDMMLYSEDSQGNPELSFSMIDAAFDYLKSIHLKPVLELSFMPKALACQDYRTTFYTQSIISMPKDIAKWVCLIRGLINHLMDRYGDEEVSTWPIYLWNTPDLENAHIGKEGMGDYNKLYLVTYQTVKECHKNLRFGAPNFTNHTMESGVLLEEFLRFARQNQCMPDFLCMNYFSMSLPPQTLGFAQTQTNLLLRSSPDALAESLEKIEQIRIRCHVENLPLHICEWNSTISHRELLNDTAFKSAYVVKNLLENYQKFDSVAYWTLSDLIEEVKLSGRQFHGGLGMFTFDGTPKAVYHAYELLAQLGDQLIAKGDGYFITKSAGEWQIILYNYQHYSALYAAGELFDMTPVNRYTPFDQSYQLKFILPLEKLADGNYTISETIINQDFGSSFDKWVELGAETLVDPKEQQYLNSSSIPKMQRKVIAVENQQFLLSRELKPHEVRLIKIRRHYAP